MRLAWVAAMLGLAACADTGRPVVTDSGCVAYAEARSGLPRPIGTGPLAEWVATTDSRMAGACRER